jgi:hypothetical protein
MSLPPTLNDREFQKFEELNGEVAVRTTVTGEIRPSGLKNGGRITEMTIDDAQWWPLPAVPLSGRNGLAIQNQSSTIKLKVNYDNSAIGYVGVEVPARGERFWDLTDAIIVYAKSQAGSIVVAVEEIS